MGTAGQGRTFGFEVVGTADQGRTFGFERIDAPGQGRTLGVQRAVAGRHLGMLGFESTQRFANRRRVRDLRLECVAPRLQLRLQRGFASLKGRFQLRDSSSQIFVRRLRSRRRLLLVAQRLRQTRFGGIGALAGVDPLAQRVEQAQHRHFGIGAGQRGEFAETLGRLRADQQHAQAVGMLELEAGILRAQFLPQFPHPEITLADHGVVEQHHRAVRQFRQPRFEIVLDRVVGMQAVDVQQIDRAVGEIGQRLVESHAHQLRKAAVRRVVCGQRLEDFIAVETGVLVALPGIHRVAFGFQPAAHHRLAEAEIRRAVVAAQFDQDPRAPFLDRPERERQMAGPCTGRHLPRRHRHADVE